jgi:hypothetical protein
VSEIEAGRDFTEALVSDEFEAASKLTYICPRMSIRGYTSTVTLAGTRQQGHGVHEAAISIERHIVQFESETPSSSSGAFIRPPLNVSFRGSVRLEHLYLHRL